MKRIILFFACAALLIGLSACGDDGKSYKGPFGFLESSGDLSKCHMKESELIGGITESSYFKREETPAQKEALDKMMAGADKKIAFVSRKSFTKTHNRIHFTIMGPSTGNGAKLKTKKMPDVGEYFSFEVSLDEFPEIGYPFDKYWIIIDKRGHIARIQHVPGSYSWALERRKDKAALHYGALVSGGEWARASDRVEDGSIDGVPKSVLERRRKFWENGGKD